MSSEIIAAPAVNQFVYALSEDADEEDGIWHIVAEFCVYALCIQRVWNDGREFTACADPSNPEAATYTFRRNVETGDWEMRYDVLADEDEWMPTRIVFNDKLGSYEIACAMLTSQHKDVKLDA